MSNCKCSYEGKKNIFDAKATDEQLYQKYTQLADIMVKYSQICGEGEIYTWVDIHRDFIRQVA